MNPIENISLIEDAAEDGDFKKVKFLFENGAKLEEIEDAMDTAYRGTKVDPPIEGCFSIVGFLAIKGFKIPTYNFYAKRIEK